MTNENLLINSLRFLSVEMIEKANSGHPGIAMGVAPMAYTLWGKHMNFNPKDQNWISRDRFILSAGHGSSLLYSLLHMYGFDVTIDDIKEFRQMDSRTPGHPEYGYTDGVEASTGPLGQGISMAVGMAVAESHFAAKYNKDDIKLFDNYTYTICGDGDLMEGISYEALSFAGTQELDKLIVLYDSNHITIEGSTDLAFKEDVSARMDAMGFQVIEVEDGNDLKAIDNAIITAKADKDRPSFIKITTHIGYGAKEVQDSAAAHGAPLGEDNMSDMRDYFGWSYDTFEVPTEAKELAKSQLEEKLTRYNEWQELEKQYKERYPEDYKELKDRIENNIDMDKFDEEYFKIEEDMATRSSSGIALNRLAERFPFIWGGSADLGPSNKSVISEGGSFNPENRAGRNIHYGVREHAMAAIANGIALYGGSVPYVATFLVFSDYLKGAMRLSGLMNVPTTYILSHDSIGVGEDGPTHQPIEQLAMIRTIPNMKLFRPADMREALYAWKYAATTDSPTALALTRQDVPNLEGSGEGVLKGAYILAEEQNELEAIIIATGSEVSTAIEAKEMLENDGIGTRVVSMPSMALYEEQDDDYKEEILPKSIRKRMTVEAGSTYGWAKYAGLDGICVGVDTFGASAPAEEVYKFFKITPQDLYNNIKKL